LELSLSKALLGRMRIIVLIGMKKCICCGKKFEPKYPEQKFCSRACYYASKRKTEKLDEQTAEKLPDAEVPEESSDVLIKKEEIPEEVWVPIEEPKVNKPVNVDFPEGFCPVCGSHIYCGRCVRFTQHKKKK